MSPFHDFCETWVQYQSIIWSFEKKNCLGQCFTPFFLLSSTKVVLVCLITALGKLSGLLNIVVDGWNQTFFEIVNRVVEGFSPVADSDLLFFYHCSITLCYFFHWLPAGGVILPRLRTTGLGNNWEVRINQLKMDYRHKPLGSNLLYFWKFYRLTKPSR